MADARFESTRSDGVCRLRAPGARWLQTGHAGGYREADAAYNVTVPEGFDRTDLRTYGARRRERAGFDGDGPTLLTGVEQRHARGARRGPVVAIATAGLSNPAALPMPDDPPAARNRGTDDGAADCRSADDRSADGPTPDDRSADDPTSDRSPDDRPAGTVNVLVGATRALDDGALASLLGVVVEAKAATLLDAAGVPGTTTDAAVVGCLPDCESAPFAGSGTAVGDAARACVREAVGASLSSRYADREMPGGPDDAEYGVATTRGGTVFEV